MSDNNTTTEAATGQVPVETFSAEYVAGLRQEAARYRTEKNDAVLAAREAANQEWAAKVEGAVAKSSKLEADLGDAWIYAAKIQAAVKAGVPTDKLLAFVDLVKGSDEATIAASVESAKALFGGFSTAVPATDPTQGSGSSVPGLNSDQLLKTVINAVGARR